MKYLCTWNDKNSSDIRTVDASFFCDDNGYSTDDFKRITLLKVGETLDLSDGISQEHTIERVL